MCVDRSLVATRSESATATRIEEFADNFEELAVRQRGTFIFFAIDALAYSPAIFVGIYAA